MKWLKRAVIVAIALVVLTPCMYCAWIAKLNDIVFRWRLPVYPGAEEVANAAGNYGANTGLYTIYFWTPDSVNEVQQYYEAFTLPFRKQEYVFSFEVREHYRTVFNPSNKPLPVVTNEFTDEIIDPTQVYHCYYKMPLQCVVIELIDFTDKEGILRPPPGPMSMIKTPEPLPPGLRGGTLIIYMYYSANLF